MLGKIIQIPLFFVRNILALLLYLMKPAFMSLFSLARFLIGRVIGGVFGAIIGFVLGSKSIGVRFSSLRGKRRR